MSEDEDGREKMRKREEEVNEKLARELERRMNKEKTQETIDQGASKRKITEAAETNDKVREKEDSQTKGCLK